MTTTFTLSEQQEARAKAWLKHHWGTIHKDFNPPDKSGFLVWYSFAPTGIGCNVIVECAWCPDDHPQQQISLTEDEDDPESPFIYDYDENWKQLPASWEKQS